MASRQERDEVRSQERFLLRGLNELRSDRHLTDVTLIVDGEQMKPCHRAVLAASSPYFRAMFTHSLVEQTQSEIEIKELDFQSVSTIVDYLYTGNISITDNNAQDLIAACNVFQIAGLYEKCFRYMEKRLTSQNSLDVYKFAKALCCTELQSASFSYICKRFADLANTEAFFSLDKDDLIDFISADELLVDDETVVYEAVLSWLLHDIGQRGRWLNEVFSYVRFVLLDDDYLEKCIAHEPLIKEFTHLTAQVNAALLYKAKAKEEESPAITPKSHNELNDAQSPSNDAIDDEMSLSSTSSQERLSKVEDIEPKSSFTSRPFYSINLIGSDESVRIPLETSQRSGMRKTEVLLFTNGRKTVLFDPLARRYFYGAKGSSSYSTSDLFLDEDRRPGVDASMPVMNNAEVYASHYGMIFLIGGLKASKSASCTVIRSQVFTFDVEKCKWKQRKSLDKPRCMFGLGELDDCLVVTGGKILSDGSISSDVQMYNPVEDEWEDAAAMIKPVYGHQCLSVRKRLYVIGGKTENGELENSVYVLNAQSNQWSQAPSLNCPRFLSGATVLRSPSATNSSSHQDILYVVGGVANNGQLLSSVEVLDPSTQQWRLAEEFPGNRCAQHVATINGIVCAIGGHVMERNSEGRIKSIQQYDVFVLRKYGVGGSIGREWRKEVNHIRGIYGEPFACTAIKIEVDKLNCLSQFDI